MTKAAKKALLEETATKHAEKKGEMDAANTEDFGVIQEAIRNGAGEIEKTIKARASVTDSSILRVVSAETKSRCQLDIIAAIGTLPKGQATVAKVIEIVVTTHKAPRSLIAAQDKLKPGFVRGYVTHMVRVGSLSSSAK